MNTLIYWIVYILVRTPLNPHWLQNMKHWQALRVIFGRVIKVTDTKRLLEVGAGDGSTKAKVLKQFPKLKYLATDYSSWDEEFKTVHKRVSKFGRISEQILNFNQQRQLDDVCDAMNLPYKNGEFDYHLSLETLEHLSSPEKYYQEASRVLKKGGYAITSTPYMFRMHGGEPDHKMDYYRYSNGFFYDMAEKNGMKVKEIYANTGVGTSVAIAINQWLILLFGNPIPNRLLASVIFLPLFIINNIIGFLIDLFPDPRFAVRLYGILQKK